MKTPMISMIVAKKGPAEKAGSKRNFCSKKGRLRPRIVASITIAERDNDMDKLSNIVPPVNITRIKAVIPRIVDRQKAITHSLFINL